MASALLPSRGALLNVVLIPPNLTFYTSDPSSHKQTISIYNLHDFPVKFVVKSTAPQKYYISEDEGTINTHCSVNIVVRHIDIGVKNEGVTDKFRVYMHQFSRGQRHALGFKDIPAQLLPRRPDTTVDADEKFRSMQSLQCSQGSPSRQLTGREGDSTHHKDGRGGLVMVVLSLAVLLGLSLPTQGETNSNLPEYLHLSINNKVVLGIILGILVTLMVQNANR